MEHHTGAETTADLSPRSSPRLGQGSRETPVCILAASFHRHVADGGWNVLLLA